MVPLGGLLFFTAFSGAAAGFGMGMTQGFQFVGKAIAGPNLGRGLQDAITPPALPNAILGFGAIVVLGVAYGFYVFGTGAGITAAAFAMVAVWSGVRVAPKPSSPFYVRLAYGSLVGRSADYAKKNDHIRCAASRDLYECLEGRFADVLGGRSD